MKTKPRLEKLVEITHYLESTEALPRFRIKLCFRSSLTTFGNSCELMGRCDAGRFRMNKPPGTRVVHPALVGWKYPGVIMSCTYAARMFWLHHGTTTTIELTRHVDLHTERYGTGWQLMLSCIPHSRKVPFS